MVNPIDYTRKLRIERRDLKSEPASEIVVSSAKRHGFKLLSKTRSLMYKRNIIGPRTEPWGTPRSILQAEEIERLILVDCVRKSK